MSSKTVTTSPPSPHLASSRAARTTGTSNLAGELQRAPVLQRYLSGLRVDHELCYALRRGKKASTELEWEPLHLQQSALDRACGLHVVLMAIMLITGLPRNRATDVASSGRSGLKRLWATARVSYFTGVRTAAVIKQVAAIAPELMVRALKEPKTDLLIEAVAAVEHDHVALVMVGDKTNDGLHWVLITGVEYLEAAALSGTSGPPRKFVPQALLGLDPDSPAPLMGCYNWRMELRGRASASGLRRCLSSDGSKAKLRLIEGVVIERSASGTDAVLRR